MKFPAYSTSIKYTVRNSMIIDVLTFFGGTIVGGTIAYAFVSLLTWKQNNRGVMKRHDWD